MVNMDGLTKLETLTYWISKPAQDISPSTIVKIEKQKSLVFKLDFLVVKLNIIFSHGSRQNKL